MQDKMLGVVLALMLWRGNYVQALILLQSKKRKDDKMKIGNWIIYYMM